MRYMLHLTTCKEIGRVLHPVFVLTQLVKKLLKNSVGE